MFNLILLASAFRLSAVFMILAQCTYIVLKIPQAISSVDVLILSSGLIIIGNFCTYLIPHIYGNNS